MRTGELRRAGNNRLSGLAVLVLLGLLAFFAIRYWTPGPGLCTFKPPCTFSRAAAHLIGAIALALQWGLV